MTRYYIEFSNTGCFKNPSDKCYYIDKNSELTFILDSKKLKNLKPILLTNIHKKNRKNKISQPNSPIISSPKHVISKSTLETEYTSFTGFFNKEMSWQCDVALGDFSGSIQLQLVWVQYDCQEQKQENLVVEEFGKVEWIIVYPQLKINGNPTPISQLIVQTMLPKSLGPSDRWLQILTDSTHINYNAFHFAPVQELGRSGSLYSIKDQLKLNPNLFKKTGDFSELENIIKVVEKEEGAISFIDILLNHTSCDSQWLTECPGSYYNEKNVPHLQSAILLDLELQKLSAQIAEGKCAEYPKKTIENEEDLKQVLSVIKEQVIQKLQFLDFFSINIEQTKKEFKEKLGKEGIKLVQTEYEIEDAENFFAKSGVEILEDLAIKNTHNIGAQRFKVFVDVDVILAEVKKTPEKFTIEGFERALMFVNKHWHNKCNGYLEDAMRGLEGTIRYEHIERKQFQVTAKHPLVSQYFSKLSNGEYAANNGWIMNHTNVHENFAESQEFHYLRRSIVIWTDLIKLRYGNCKNDSKPLWKRMKQYVQTMAEIFHGFRIDNAHSTPLHVGEYFLRKARNVNRDLLVFAELFTGSPETDSLFVKRLGLNALVRETIHNTESEHLYKHLKYIAQNSENYIGTVSSHYEFDVEKGEKMKALVAKLPSSLMYDQTHDNEALIKTHNLQQMNCLVALNSFANVFQGSVKGYDELYPDKICVVSEERLYKAEPEIIKTKIEKENYFVGITYRPTKKLHFDDKVSIFGSFNNWKEGVPCVLEGDVFIARFAVSAIGTYFYKFTFNDEWVLDENKQEQEGNHYFTITCNKVKFQYDNLAQVRKSLNSICQEICVDFPQISIHKHGYGVISITREHTSKHKSYMMITRTALEQTSDFVNFEIDCPGQLDAVKHIYIMEHSTPQKMRVVEEQFISGYNTEIYEEFNLREFADLFFCPRKNKQVLHFYNLKPGTVIVLECSLAEEEKQKIVHLNKAVNNTYNETTFKLFDTLMPVDINYLLYICDQEEWEMHSSGLYHIPGRGYQNYAGFAGLYHDIIQGSLTKNVQLPLIHNLYDGNWIIDFLENRLHKRSGETLNPITQYISDTFKYLKLIPRQHKAYYFFLILNIFQEQIVNKIYKNVKLNTDSFKSTFSKNLLQATYQFISASPSQQFQSFKVSMAAGLPHFSTGWSRAWGRDTFIAFRGGLLLPGMYEEARQIILMFASTCRHGLIPNLLDGGHNSRFNNRDSCWWFIKAISDYLAITKDEKIWQANVEMQFLDDSFEVHKLMKKEGKQVHKKLHEIVFEIFQKHANGVLFREWRAGADIDSNMNSEGFNIQLQLDLETGFIVGGNNFNCLTWMDKMGSSHKSGNRGVPATSRNGAPIELTALLKCGLDFMQKQFEKGLIPHKGVQIKDSVMTWKEWSQLIQKNFEKHYWIPKDASSHSQYKYAYITGMYKDLVFTKGEQKKEFQLRPNSCIAIAVAPELFTKENALSHLENVEKYLVEENSLGIKTLDPLSDEYTSYYNNEDDSTTYATSHGFSYHNGPEWVWIYAYFLQAMIRLKSKDNGFRAQSIMSYLAPHKQHLANNEWCSLPEMTNGNGNFCKFSCPAQAWSIACILEVYYDLQQTK